MPGSYRTVGRIATRLPGLRRLPVLKLLAIGEVALLARDHIEKLTPRERRRLVELVRSGRGRPRNLSPAERDELSALVAAAQPRLFLGAAAEKLSPVPLPQRFIRGSRKR
ncbi:MAG: hypothetical protein ACR2LV_00425 [Solirubrobacteraceae bacterium]